MLRVCANCAHRGRSGEVRRVGTAVAGLGDRLRSGEPAARELEFRTDDLAGSFGSAGAQSVRSQAMPLHTKQRPVSRACLSSHDLSDENLPEKTRKNSRNIAILGRPLRAANDGAFGVPCYTLLEPTIAPDVFEQM